MRSSVLLLCNFAVLNIYNTSTLWNNFLLFAVCQVKLQDIDYVLFICSQLFNSIYLLNSHPSYLSLCAVVTWFNETLICLSNVTVLQYSVTSLCLWISDQRCPNMWEEMLPRACIRSHGKLHMRFENTCNRTIFRFSAFSTHI